MASSSQDLFFDPDLHPEDTLKQFDRFTNRFELRYAAQYPDPPKVSIDSAIERWKIINPDKAITLEDYDKIRDDWMSQDKVAKFLGMFSSPRLYEDWQTAEPDEGIRKKASWKLFTESMQKFYKPTENLTLKHFQFRTISQRNEEVFTAFCSRVEKEAKSCNFKCEDANCTVEETVIRDQIIIGTHNEKIQQDALKDSWDLKTLRTKGMQIESAERGASELTKDNELNYVGKYSRKQKNKDKIEKRNPPNKSQSQSNQKETKPCHACGNQIKGSIMEHLKNCKAKKEGKCEYCGKPGHVEKACYSKLINKVEQETKDETGEPTYPIHIFNLETKNSNFTVEVMINNVLGEVLADTGAKVSVCGRKQADLWGLMEKMVPSSSKLKPYNSAPIPVIGKAICSVTYGSTSIPVAWHIIENSCQPILSGTSAEQLGIITFQKNPNCFNPINMIHSPNKDEIEEILSTHKHVFNGVGKLKNYQVKLHVDESVKPIATPARPVPYHLQERVNKVMEEMVEQDIIELQPPGLPAPWVSNTVLSPKDDGSLRITLGAQNINKAIQSSNLPIPRQEDIKAKLHGATVFSKMDLRSAFWQLELHPDSRPLTVFHCNNRLYRYKRLTMGVKPAQGELNTALSSVFDHIPQAHVIHDDLILAAKDLDEHNTCLKQVMEAFSSSGLTLNQNKCEFGKAEIKFWGLIVSKDGVRPDPEKVHVLENIARPESKEELISFLCMMQSNAEFIPNFAKHSAILRKMTHKNAHFKWTKEAESTFVALNAKFKDNVLLQYFDLAKPIFLFTDAHVTGLGAMLAQGNTMEEAKPVAVASRTTSDAESRYPQIDLEAMGIDFALRRFRNYLVGAPCEVIVVTDHKPLVPIFNGSRKGTIRTERIALRHQDIRFKVEYQEGKINQADYLSRHAISIKKLPVCIQNEANDLNNLLYMLHATPVTDTIGLGQIAVETGKDQTLNKIKEKLAKGNRWIHKSDTKEVAQFKEILPELTVTANGIILKGERIVLPASLQKKAISVAHEGAHPGQSGLKRRMRFHFFFHGLDKMVEEYANSCLDCCTNVDKKTKQPIKPHKVPSRNWEKVSVDLYGPMPSSHHIVVVQDLSSRFPAAKLVSSTSADKVIPALAEIYDAYGNPDQQLSDNGSPFNSEAMSRFATQRGIEIQTAPPHHPSSNPVENFMRPLGKAMKIGFQNKGAETKTLQDAISSYRNTPHPQTGIPPASMFFRDGMRTNFPTKPVSNEQIMDAKEKDVVAKQKNEDKVNSSKYRKSSSFSLGDKVLVRDYKRTRKFEPLFTKSPYVVTSFNHETQVATVAKGRKTLRRHADDIKPYIQGEIEGGRSATVPVPGKMQQQSPIMPSTSSSDEEISSDNLFEKQQAAAPQNEVPNAALNDGEMDSEGQAEIVLRRSQRILEQMEKQKSELATDVGTCVGT